MGRSAAAAALTVGGGMLSGILSDVARADDRPAAERSPTVRTVLGRVAPAKLGVALMHEHAPLVDWSELYEMPAADPNALSTEMLQTTLGMLARFHESLAGLGKTVGAECGPGAIVECTPIRVGRYPRLMQELARQSKVHVVACTGFWCEAMAPQHPWATTLIAERDGVQKIAKIYIREIEQGMEDPAGAWGECYTEIPVGIIKCATSTYLRPSERRCHQAAAIASKETGCPITTHTTDGGGLEQVRLFIKEGVQPEKVIIGHQGRMDDRQHDDSAAFHRELAGHGCYVQFDRVGHAAYSPEKTALQIRRLVEAGHVRQILVSHDHVPFFYQGHAPGTRETGWKRGESDFAICTTALATALQEHGLSAADLRTIYLENPRRALAF